jgi:hypothetical protein
VAISARRVQPGTLIRTRQIGAFLGCVTETNARLQGSRRCGFRPAAGRCGHTGLAGAWKHRSGRRIVRPARGRLEGERGDPPLRQPRAHGTARRRRQPSTWIRRRAPRASRAAPPGATWTRAARRQQRLKGWKTHIFTGDEPNLLPASSAVSRLRSTCPACAPKASAVTRSRPIASAPGAVDSARRRSVLGAVFPQRGTARRSNGSCSTGFPSCDWRMPAALCTSRGKRRSTATISTL